MASYPSFHQRLEGSVKETLDDLVLDRAMNGALKARAYYSAVKFRFTVRHILTTAELATLQTFYNTNRLLTVTFTWERDSVAYTCLFEGPLKEVTYHRPDLIEVEVRLSQQ